MTARVIAFAPVRSFLYELALMDGLEPVELDQRVFIPALHAHRPDAPQRVEIRQAGDIDNLLNEARRCLWADCTGRQTVARIDSERREERRILREMAGVGR